MSMRIGGLASGMDIDQMVSDLMKAHRIPLEKMNQEKQILEWQKEDFRSINTQLSTFRESLFELKLQRTFNVKLASSSNESVVEVTASNNALVASSTLTVSQLAEAAFKTSSAALGSGESLGTLNSQLGLTGTISFSINGVEFTINADTESINDLVKKINNTDIGVQASYDRNFDRLFLSTTAAGSEAKIEIVDGTDAEGMSLFAEALKMDTAAVQGKDAQITFNGAALTMSTNKFTINGVTYSLKGVSPLGSDGQAVGTVVSVKSDTERIFQTIMDFVNLYNETLKKINDELNEQYFKDYKPLTDTMREEMDEDQIEKWTSLARSGLLKNESILTGIVSQFRLDVYGFVDGLPSAFNSLSDIGITTGHYTEQGKLYVNEEELRKAIETDPEAVQKLFTATSDDGNVRNEGIAVRLYNDVLNGMSKITEKAGAEAEYSRVDNSVIGKRLRSIDEKIDRFEDKLKLVEDRYWRQFSAMEEAINIMNSQYLWITSMLGTRRE